MPADDALRLVSYNIRALRDDASAVVRVIRSLDPDVLCIQEAPRFGRWRGRCAALARDTDLVIVSGGRSAAGNLLLVRRSVDVLAARDVLFSKEFRRHQRGVTMGVLRRAGREFAVAGTHLDGWPQPRMRHLRQLRCVLDAFLPPGVPMMLAGDMNEDPGTPVWRALLGFGADAWASAGTGDGLTLNVTEPTRRIDGIFVAPAITVVHAASIDSADVRIASDHRPVLAELKLPG